jgi:hypothetical protein
MAQLACFEARRYSTRWYGTGLQLLGIPQVEPLDNDDTPPDPGALLYIIIEHILEECNCKAPGGFSQGVA